MKMIPHYSEWLSESNSTNSAKSSLRNELLESIEAEFPNAEVSPSGQYSVSVKIGKNSWSVRALGDPTKARITSGPIVVDLEGGSREHLLKALFAVMRSS